MLYSTLTFSLQLVISEEQGILWCMYFPGILTYCSTPQPLPCPFTCPCLPWRPLLLFLLSCLNTFLKCSPVQPPLVNKTQT